MEAFKSNVHSAMHYHSYIRKKKYINAQAFSKFLTPFWEITLRLNCNRVGIQQRTYFLRYLQRNHGTEGRKKNIVWVRGVFFRRSLRDKILTHRRGLRASYILDTLRRERSIIFLLVEAQNFSALVGSRNSITAVLPSTWNVNFFGITKL